jgi:hypothetical protein
MRNALGLSSLVALTVEACFSRSDHVARIAKHR